MVQPTLDEFVASVQAAAHRRRAIEQTLFGPPRRVSLPASDVDGELRAELDALAEEIVTGTPRHKNSHPASPEAKRLLSVTSRNRTETDRPHYTEPGAALTADQIAEVELLRRVNTYHWTWTRLGERYGMKGNAVKLAVLGIEKAR